MALVLKDRVKETSVSTGTGAIALLGATGAFQPFSTIGNGNQTYYAIVGQTTTEWEVGIGTYTTSTDTLSRDTILASSNSNTIVTFSAGTKDVFITYPSEKAIYEEPDGDTLINAGPITVLGPGVSNSPPPTPYAETLGRFYGNVDSFQQVYLQNQYNGTDASSDIVAYNNLGDGTNYFVDMGIASSTYSSATYPIFTANSAYLYNSGLTTGTGAAGETSELLIGTGTLNSDLVLFTGGVDTTNEAVRISGADQTIEVQKGVTLNETLDVTGAATFGSTVLLDANPTLALQAATKQYVDNQVTAGLHIHAPVRVETTANLNATYAQGGTTFNITDITSTTTVTTSANHGLSVNDQIWLTTTAGNGLSTNIAYFVFSTPALNQLTLSLAFDGTQITGLTNASGLTYATRANSGVGATLTNAGTQVALTVDGIAVSAADRVMVRLQTNGAENGVYVVTTVGSGSTNWVLTRSTDANMVNPGDPDGLGTGDYFFTQEGTLNAGDSHVLTTEPNTMIIGYTTLTYTQFSGSVDYVGGTNINITGQTISLTGTVAATNGGTGTSTVTTGDVLYGSATNTWSKLAVGSAYQSLVVNGSGTQVEWNAVNLSSSNAVTGVLAATLGGTGQTTYALGDTLYSSAANTISKLSGNTSTTKQYLSQTGTGSASAAPSWASISASDIISGTLPAVRGGTGQSSYAVGDLLYADTTTTLAKLAATATGRVLISNGVSAAPSYSDTVSLTSLTSTTINGTTLSTTGNTILGDATTDTLNVGNGGLVKDASGNVGIGTSSVLTNARLDVRDVNRTGNASNQVILTTTTQAPDIGGTLGLGGLWNATDSTMFGVVRGGKENSTSGNYAGYLSFGTVANGGSIAERMRITSAGNVGIGTGSPTAPLTIQKAGNLGLILRQNTTVDRFKLFVGDGTSGYTADENYIASTNSGLHFLAGATGTTEVMSLSSAGALNISGLTASSAVATDASKNLVSVTNTGSGNNVLATSPTLVTPNLGTPASGTLTNCTFPTLNQNTTGSSGSCTGNAATATNVAGLVANTYSTYGNTATTTAKSGWYGLLLGNLSSHLNVMGDGSGNGGIYRESTGKWALYFESTNNSVGIMSSTTSASYALYVTGAIYATGNVVAYSDRRKKENIVTIDNALDKVCQMRGVYYNKIDDDKKVRQVGVIAQEMQEVLPEAVSYAEDVDEYGVAYGNIAGILIEAIKDLKAEIKELKAEVDELKRAK